MSYLLCQADARRIPLADGSVHCAITSPPYFGLRDYGIDGQIGLEATPDEFVAAMVAVFREVWRVLRDDGTCWLNLGDSYCTKPAGNVCGANSCLGRKAREHYRAGMFGKSSEDLKPKDMIGIPWRVAFALQADGWTLRSDIIWSKPNPMPESVTDRPTKAHEYVFLMAKGERYFFDAEAVREVDCGRPAGNVNGFKDRQGAASFHVKSGGVGSDGWIPGAGRNLRTVWTIPTHAYPGAHFATFPPRLVEPCIKAGTSEKGCCPRCGAPWRRVVEPTEEYAAILAERKASGRRRHDALATLGLTVGTSNPSVSRSTCTLGWQPTCSHGLDPAPCVVLDPFAGSGTTLQVADGLGRHGIGFDLSREYLGLAARRLSRPHARVPRSGKEEFHPLFGGIEP